MAGDIKDLNAQRSLRNLHNERGKIKRSIDRNVDMMVKKRPIHAFWSSAKAGSLKNALVNALAHTVFPGAAVERAITECDSIEEAVRVIRAKDELIGVLEDIYKLKVDVGRDGAPQSTLYWTIAVLP